MSNSQQCMFYKMIHMTKKNNREVVYLVYLCDRDERKNSQNIMIKSPQNRLY